MAVVVGGAVVVTTFDVVVWTEVSSVVVEKDDVVAPTVVVVVVSVAHAPVMINTAIPVASKTQDLIPVPLEKCVPKEMNVDRADGVSVASGRGRCLLAVVDGFSPRSRRPIEHMFDRVGG